MKPFDEALAAPGPLLAAWDEEDNTRTRLGLFSVADDHVTELAQTNVPHDQREDLVDRLVARKIRIGAQYGGKVFTWVADDESFAVWSGSELVASGTRTTKSVSGVTIFVDPDDQGHRGVRLTLASGRSELVVEEHDPTPRIDPAYGDDELLLDTLWAKYLGTHLALWFLVPLDEPSARTTYGLELAIARSARTLAAQLDAAASSSDLVLSMGPIGRSAELAFRIGEARNVLDIQVTFKDGGTTSATIKRGTSAQISAFLRRVSTPSTVLFAMNEQITKRKP